ncbi:helix-turn-helix domain-containing protein [Paracoccus sp. (in: a-proteobacteria)]|uniref:helix-turn-helix domain-containing protein n=1 Tax=Paracoccus sp. TaxID=267 RepID=UPI003A8C85BD
MSYDQKGWKNGFPFSVSPLRSKSLSHPYRLFTADIRDARVIAAGIPDGKEINAAATESGATLPQNHPRNLTDPLPVAARPFAQRPVPQQNGLRLIKLESFVWGSRANPPQPRTRADHTLICVTSGSVHLDLPRRHDLLRTDAVRYIPAGTAFAALPRKHAAGYALLIAPALLRDLDFPRHALSGNAAGAAPALLATLQELAFEAARPEPGPELRLLLGVLGLRLSRLAPARPATSAAPLPCGTGRPMVDRFLALAATRLGQGQTIADLAEELGTTTAFLDNACQMARGRRAVDLVHSLRLERAVELLRSGRRSPAQIACELGYSSHAHFTRACVAATGRPPEAFRNHQPR